MTISPDDFRDVLRCFASGVTIVTVRAAGRNHGLTVSAFTSVSSDPPLVAVVIDRKHDAHELLQSADAVFAVNLLAEDQEELSNRFAFEKEEDRFRRGEWSTATTGAPVLEDALAWLDCMVAARHDAGSHVIYVGQVKASRVVRPKGRPLLYWDRGYRQLTTETS